MGVDTRLKMATSRKKSEKLSPQRVREIAWMQGYEEIYLAERESGHMLSFSHNSKYGCGGPDKDRGPVRIDVYFTTGTVTTSLNHPRQGKGQLKRSFQPDYVLLQKIFENPRHHTDSGYHTREEKRKRQESRFQVYVREEGDEDIPEEFYDTKWPHPRLLRNRPTALDDALVWFMESEKEQIEKYVGMRVSNRNKYINVRATGKFRCHLCRKIWISHFAWILFDMKNQQVKRMYGQKCNRCRNFYSRPMPFFFSEPEDLTRSNGTTPWRDIVLKAIDIWIHRTVKTSLPYDPDELVDEDSIVEGGDDNN